MVYKGGRANRSPSCVFVGNLPDRVHERDIHDLFDKYGEIRDVDIKRGRTSNYTSYAFVEFYSVRAAEDAVECRDGYEFERHRLRVEFAGEKKPRRDHHRDNYDDHGSNYPPPTRTEHRLVISNLPYGCRWQHLKDHMRKAGPVGFVNIDHGRGYVDFIHRSDMKYALRKLDGSELVTSEDACRIRVYREDHRHRSRTRSRSHRGSISHRSRTRSRSHRRSISHRSCTRSRSHRRSISHRSRTRSRSHRRSMSHRSRTRSRSHRRSISHRSHTRSRSNRRSISHRSHTRSKSTERSRSRSARIMNGSPEVDCNASVDAGLENFGTDRYPQEQASSGKPMVNTDEYRSVSADRHSTNEIAEKDSLINPDGDSPKETVGIHSDRSALA